MVEKSLEFRMLERETKNPIEEGNSVTYTFLEQEIYGLNFIKYCQGSKEQSITEYAHLVFNTTLSFLERLYSEHGNELIEQIIFDKFYTFRAYDESKKSNFLAMIKINNPNFFNIMLEEYCHSTTETVSLIFDFYIQSFVDSFNQFNDNGPTLLLQSKRDLRVKAANNLDSSFADVLLEIDYLEGFSKNNEVVINDSLEYIYALSEEQ